MFLEISTKKLTFLIKPANLGPNKDMPNSIFHCLDLILYEQENHGGFIIDHPHSLIKISLESY